MLRNQHVKNGILNESPPRHRPTDPHWPYLRKPFRPRPASTRPPSRTHRIRMGSFRPVNIGVTGVRLVRMSLRNALLGLLVFRPGSGYDLLKMFDTSLGYVRSEEHTSELQSRP